MFWRRKQKLVQYNSESDDIPLVQETINNRESRKIDETIRKELALTEWQREYRKTLRELILKKFKKYALKAINDYTKEKYDRIQICIRDIIKNSVTLQKKYHGYYIECSDHGLEWITYRDILRYLYPVVQEFAKAGYYIRYYFENINGRVVSEYVELSTKPYEYGGYWNYHELGKVGDKYTWWPDVANWRRLPDHEGNVEGYDCIEGTYYSQEYREREIEIIKKYEPDVEIK